MTAFEPGRLDAATLAEGRRLLDEVQRLGYASWSGVTWSTWLRDHDADLLAIAEDAAQARAELADARAALDRVEALCRRWDEKRDWPAWHAVAVACIDRALAGPPGGQPSTSARTHEHQWTKAQIDGTPYCAVCGASLP